MAIVVPEQTFFFVLKHKDFQTLVYEVNKKIIKLQIGASLPEIMKKTCGIPQKLLVFRSLFLCIWFINYLCRIFK